MISNQYEIEFRSYLIDRNFDLCLNKIGGQILKKTVFLEIGLVLGMFT